MQQELQVAIAINKLVNAQEKRIKEERLNWKVRAKAIKSFEVAGMQLEESELRLIEELEERRFT